ncbi:hypothetical protein ICL81_04450 [Leucobacter sp. cx-328]|uniref:hypothetical protein n=1 Tax=unclassified Leucobacter TaxID=2621730 RepID=UPI00165D40F5|nr:MULTISPECIES: hypothetical protein [unclassified Leucobacter]MBC9943777.1 hypothetical protein [Leucobacter sp. cx-328]
MSSGALGGGMIFVVIAVLWGAILVPGWNRRREFKAAERNAFRLQRTLRVLAETMEMPEEMRLEATAKEALAHEKILRSEKKREEAERSADLAEARAAQVRAEIRAQQMQRKQAATQRAARLSKPGIRRVRSIAALVTLLGVVAAFVSIGLLFAGAGAGPLIWSLLGLSAGAGTLVLLAPGRAKLEPIADEVLPEEAVAPAAESAVAELSEVEIEDGAATAAHNAAQRAAAERIARARAMARARARASRAGSQPRMENQPDSMLLREAREQVAREQGLARAGAVVPDERPVTAQIAEQKSEEAAADSMFARYEQKAGGAGRKKVSPFSEMGRVGDTTEGMPDLDDVLRRRRIG